MTWHLKSTGCLWIRPRTTAIERSRDPLRVPLRRTDDQHAKYSPPKEPNRIAVKLMLADLLVDGLTRINCLCFGLQRGG
jgi:uncharacterized sporulation protein YeaH/YhbH (DUF444 family)